MSSRALRKLQREKEQQKHLENLNKQNDEHEREEDAPAPRALNAFDMLNAAEEEDDEPTELKDVSSTESQEGARSPNTDITESRATASDKPKGKRSKKNKGRKKGKGIARDESPAVGSQRSGDTSSQPDEIDLALRSLSTKSKAGPNTALGPTMDKTNLQLYRLLAVESKHLNALNEMKRLFGNVVLENEDEGAGTPRRRGRGPQQLDLGGALAARHSPVSHGQGLAGLALRRNVFIQGKEEWPKAAGGGLAMELVEKMEDGTVEYRFVHNTIYQDIQRQFESCVESMDPQRMISLLQFNPYHISTLLQVSEIAKQQGDHSVSGDLLERALFSFGRSVHSSFTTALSEGKARLDFRRPENREFWLTAWRYMTNLGQRGTWRTAYEWAKLILSLDPEGDPYCAAKILDQLALRGGQSEHFLQLSQNPFYTEDLWKGRPNIEISSALAEYRIKQAQGCRATLARAINKYPWIFVRLFQELNINRIPKSIWGQTPRTDRERFDCEHYVHNAKDLWNTPETISFLVEVADSTDAQPPQDATTTPITLDEARHAILSNVPTIINLIPRSFTTQSTSSSDPLPPPNDLLSYAPTPATHSTPAYRGVYEDSEDEDNLPPPLEANPRGQTDTQELQGLYGFFSRLIPGLGRPGNPEIGERINSVSRAAAEAGVPPDVLQERSNRLVELMRRMTGGQPVNQGGLLGMNEPLESGRDAQGVIRSEGQDPGRPYATNESDDDDEHIIDHRPSSSTPAPLLEPASEPAPYDDERNQRWLAGQGMLRLKDFTAQHGPHESTWPTHSSEREIVGEYAGRVLQLKQPKTRRFILDYVLQQGAGQQVKELIEREIERTSS